jgi:hypothetical protein
MSDNPQPSTLNPQPSRNKSAIVELPPMLCPRGEPSIAALVRRNHKAEVSARIYVAKSFSFAGEPIADNFHWLATIRQFAWHGIIQSATAARAGNLATAIFRCRLDGPDLALPEICDHDAIAGEFPVFASAAGGAPAFLGYLCQPTLISDAKYDLRVIPHDSGLKTVDSGSDLFIIPRESIAPIPMPLHFGSAQFKISIGVQQPGDAEPFTVNLKSQHLRHEAVLKLLQPHLKTL